MGTLKAGAGYLLAGRADGRQAGPQVDDGSRDRQGRRGLVAAMMVPNADLDAIEAIAARLHELADAVSAGPAAVAREFTMRIPADIGRDADIVLARAADALIAMRRELSTLRYVRDRALALLATETKRAAE